MTPWSGYGDAALAYGRDGWPVFPLHHPVKVGPRTGSGRARCSCRKILCDGQGKHPRTAHGLKDATTDLAVIRAWWEQWPRANIGLVTGQAFDVLDVDSPEAHQALIKVGNVGALTGPRAFTGRGLHYYVRPTGIGNKAGLVPGVDWRGLGGYVVGPPSLHYSGHRYRWVQGYGPGVSLGSCPAWLEALLRPPEPAIRPLEARGGPDAGNGPRYGRAALEAECRELVKAPEGTRNQRLNRAAFKLGQLIADGLDEGAVLTALTDAGIRAGLGQWEVEATVRSGLAAGARSPRRRRGRP